MAEIVLVVEVIDDKDLWRGVETFAGEEEDIRPQAEETARKFIEMGWPENEVRITKSNFRQFNRKWREE